MRIFTDLNLSAGTPARVQPKIGEWGPLLVPTTRSKKRMRIWVSLAFVLVLTALVALGYFFYRVFNG